MAQHSTLDAITNQSHHHINHNNIHIASQIRSIWSTNATMMAITPLEPPFKTWTVRTLSSIHSPNSLPCYQISASSVLSPHPPINMKSWSHEENRISGSFIMMMVSFSFSLPFYCAMRTGWNATATHQRLLFRRYWRNLWYSKRLASHSNTNKCTWAHHCHPSQPHPTQSNQ